VPNMPATQGDTRDLANKIATLQSLIEQQSEGIIQLRTYVIDGNGKPGLLDRVSQLEAHRGEDSKSISLIRKYSKAIAKKMNAEAVRRADEVERQRAREIEVKERQESQAKALADKLAAETKANRKDRIGWIIGLLGVIGGLVPEIARLFGKG
jgi:hypothetical protein